MKKQMFKRIGLWLMLALCLPLGLGLLTGHLAGLESFGVPYLAPLVGGGVEGCPAVLRPPLPWVKWREGAVRTGNRRDQR